MAEDGTVGRSRTAAELLLLDRLPAFTRPIVGVVVAAGCGFVGAYSLVVQEHFAAHRLGGRLGALLAEGSSAATAWTGWVAAAFFLIALLRLRRGDPEPPAGRTPLDSMTTRELRAGLVREYTLVRGALLLLGVIALVEAARGLRYGLAALTGDSIARNSVAATLIEAFGLIVATVVLALWALSFRRQLLRIGALRT